MAKISVSIDDDDLTWLRARARRKHAGNVSASIVEGIRLVRHNEALQALLDDLGAPRPSPAELDRIAAELDGARATPARKGRRRAA